MSKDSENEEEFYEVFKVFDSDGNGLIGLDELKEMSEALNQRLSEEELKDILKEADGD